MVKELLVLDIETSGFDVNKDQLKIVGMYSVDDDQYYFYSHNLTNKPLIQKILDEHRCLITFNGKNFDNPFMTKAGYNIKYKIQIDIMEIFRYKRTTLIRFEGFSSYSLKNLARDVLNISEEEGKGEIDYKIFQKTQWTVEEKQEIISYQKKDLELTYKLFKFLEQHFEAYKAFISSEDVKKYNHIRTSSGSYAYLAICNMMGVEAKYNDSKEKIETFEGGFVADPTVESLEGNIYCFDFKSAYPHAFMQMNLYTERNGNLPCECCTEQELFKGNEMFPLNGKYCSKKMGKAEINIRKIFEKRMEVGKGHPLDKPLKVSLNTLYGLASSPWAYWLYNMNTASDCTLICRNSIKFAKEYFEKNGYEFIYTDTDSVYINDVFNDKDKILKIKDEIITEIKKNMLFPQDTFVMELEAEISYIHFFFKKDGDMKKKNYLYVTKNDKLVVKGLDVIQKDCSNLGKLIYKKIKDNIIKRNDCKFEESYLLNLIKTEVYNNPSIIAKRFTLKEKEAYSSETSQQYKLMIKYGEGEHLLVPNYRIGIGESVKYCSLEDVKKLLPEEICLSNVYEELSPFAINGLKSFIERENIKKKYIAKMKIPITQTLLKF